MACSAHTFAPVSRLVARVCGFRAEQGTVSGHQGHDKGDAEYFGKVTACLESHAVFCQEVSKAHEATPTLEEAERKVNIDKTTSVPTDLYWSLMKAGEMAKNRGQHQLQERRRPGRDGSAAGSPRPCLVKTSTAPW
mmetsp:Transcript_53934/g.144468  ORF Transcript_53934/g.144468 Transcript_53934/m.144468 type:complete len:136 (-) Transcript_53934:66-473(-)